MLNIVYMLCWGVLTIQYVRWNGCYSNSDTPAHVLASFRSVLSTLTNEQFIWRPYTPLILSQLPPECIHDIHLWGYCGWMIFYSTVEPHLAHRVCRQFGYIQDIPNTDFVLTPNVHQTLHTMTLRGRAGIDWVNVHAQYIEFWNNRVNYVFQGLPINPQSGIETAPGYLTWYIERTVLSPHNPSRRPPAHQYPAWGSTQLFYEEGYREIYNRASSAAEIYPESQSTMHDFRDLSQQVLNFGHNQDRVNYSSQGFQYPTQDYRPTSTSSPPYFSQPNQDNVFVDSFINYNEPQDISNMGFRRPYSPVHMQNLGSSSHQASGSGFRRYTPIQTNNVASSSQQIPGGSYEYYQDFHLSDDFEPDAEAGEVQEQFNQGVRRGNRHRRGRGCGTGGHY